MPDSELRTLQEKAYGRAGGLTDAEAARLRELEGAGYDASTGSATQGAESRPPREERSDETKRLSPASSSGDGVSSRSARSTSEVGDASTGSAAQSAEATSGEGWRTALRRHARAVAIASAVLLIVGLGAGWALFAPHVHDAVALTGDEVQRKLDLIDEREWDEGTLRAVARDDDALVWFGTTDAGTQHCIVLDVGDLSQTGCADLSLTAQYGVSASVSFPPEDEASGGFGRSVNAYAMLSTEGEPMVSIQRWDYDSSMFDQFDGDERTRAEALVQDEGFQMGISLVGYVEDQPVWVGDRLNDTAFDKCLIVDAYEMIACGDPDDVLSDGITVGWHDTAGQSVTIEARYTNWGSPYLTVTNDLDQTPASSGSDG